MAITRRQFLKRTGAMTAGSLLGPQLFGNPFVRQAFADTIGDRYFIILDLSGGNDGLNTATPITDGSGTLRADYETHRRAGSGGLRLATTELAPGLVGTDPNTGAQIGLHPGLVTTRIDQGGTQQPGGLSAAIAAGEVAVIQGCGYPDYNLSHDESATIWQTANPYNQGAYASTGWAGRHLAVNYGPTDVPGVTISGQIAAELRQADTSVLAMYGLEGFGFPYDNYYGSPDPDQAAKDAAFQALYASAGASAHASTAFIGNSGTSTLVSGTAYGTLHDSYLNASEPGGYQSHYDAYEGDFIGGMASDFREIAKIMYGVRNGVPSVNARFFQVEHGGFDTHSDQRGADPDGQHYSIHQNWAEAVRIFRDDLIDMGLWDKTVIMVWSEFSRRIPQNDNGTDHGSQGPMFVIGGAVNGGVYGNHPNIAPAALDDNENTVYSQAPGDPYRSTDIRDVYGTILKHWLNMPAGNVAPGVLPIDAGDPDTRWTSPNLDLGFLP